MPIGSMVLPRADAPIGFLPFSAVPRASQFFEQAGAPAISPYVATIVSLFATPAMIRTGNTVPIVMVAGVPGFKHLAIQLAYSRNQTPNVNYVTAQTWSIYYANALTVALVPPAQPLLTNVTGAAISTGHVIQSSNVGPTTTPMGGQDLVLKASANCTLGGPDVLWSLVFVTVPVAVGT